MKKIINVLTILFIMGLITLKVYAQIVPVGKPVLDDYYRRMQLLGKVYSSISFTVRPIDASALQVRDVIDPDSSLQEGSWLNFSGTIISKDEKFLFKILPLSWK